ncbi:hypothetical protein A3758_08040 [Oleiphilus sp. HI0118]|nr:hypothetical protein A3758_08040 [Oleiphilus sp. HI0118]
MHSNNPVPSETSAPLQDSILQYHALSKLLAEAGISQPTLVIDQAALNRNIAQLKQILNEGFVHRLVVKSLPCMQLIDHISAQTQSETQRFMCFHAPFIQQIASRYALSDILLGKPLPAAAFEQLLVWFMQQPKSKSAPKLSQVQWLIDSHARLEQYQAIAKKHHASLRINLEINIGLHRGGFSLNAEFEDTITLLEKSNNLRFAGLMGYEAHAAKIPSILGGLKGALDASWHSYEAFKERVEHLSVPGTCFNSGGSTTFTEYTAKAPCNELSVGSALLKPCDFDLPHLTQFESAVFIATPLLKRVDRISVPGPAALSSLLRKAKQLPLCSGYIYGGNWLAEPCYPSSAKLVPIFGRSSNQELYAFDDNCAIQADDLMLFRPKQSESVLLQFGDVAVLNHGQIDTWWPALTQGARFDLGSSPSSTSSSAKQSGVHDATTEGKQQ